MEDLSGRVAVITGGASGIGFALAARLGAEGMSLVLADVEGAALELAAKQLVADGYDVEAVVTDVTDADQVDALAARAVDRFGAVHVVCNNAGVATIGPLWEQSLADVRWVIDVDLWGVIHGVRTFMPILLRQGEPAHIVNTSSIAGLVPSPGIGPYDIAKAGVVALSESLVLDLDEIDAPIGVSVLCPGVVPTRIGHSGRNRPGRAAAPLDLPTQTDLPATALLPDQIAGRVVDAIRADQFWIVTHAGSSELITARSAGIVTGGRPVAPPVF